MVVARDVLAQQRGALRQSQPARGAVVLDRDRHAGERPWVAGGDRRSGRQRAVGVDVDERAEAPVERLDALERVADELGGAQLTRAHESGERRRGGEHEVGLHRLAGYPAAGRPGLPTGTAIVCSRMSDDGGIRSGLEGVVAFATQIAEPDRDGGALRYRGVDIEDLVGTVAYERVWGLLVDGSFDPGLRPGSPVALPLHSADARVDLQAALALLAASQGLAQLIDIDAGRARDELATVSAAALSFVAQSARGPDRPPVSPSELESAGTAAERFLAQWRGEADPAHARAIDAYWISAAEHGMNASTFTARVVASTGADVAAALSAAVGALSGPLHGGAPARVLKMLDEVAAAGDARRWVIDTLDRGERLMGFGHRVYRAEDPRARVLRRTAHELGSPRVEVAEAVEEAALEELRARHPDRVLATNVEFWSAVVLDFAEVPPSLFTPMFACARTAGWSAHVLEQKHEGRLIRPSARYVGEGARGVETVA